MVVQQLNENRYFQHDKYCRQVETISSTADVILNAFSFCIQVPSCEELRRYLLPLVIPELHSDKRSVRGQSAGRLAGHVRDHVTADDSILNTSISSLSESGYDGDMEDEGDLNADDTLLDEELFSELADDQHGVLNKQSRDSSFLNWEEFSRTSSTPSILHPAGSHSGFDFEEQDMETDSEPVPIDNGIHSSSELRVPIVVEADDNMELGESCAKPLASNLHTRQPLRSIENNNLPVRASISWKSQRRTSAWSRSVTQ